MQRCPDLPVCQRSSPASQKRFVDPTLFQAVTFATEHMPDRATDTLPPCPPYRLQVNDSPGLGNGIAAIEQDVTKTASLLIRVLSIETCCLFAFN